MEQRPGVTYRQTPGSAYPHIIPEPPPPGARHASPIDAPPFVMPYLQVQRYSVEQNTITYLIPIWLRLAHNPHSVYYLPDYRTLQHASTTA